MNILDLIKGGTGANDLILKTVMKKLAKDGVKQVIIDIANDGEYNMTTVFLEDERQTVVNTDTYRFLLNKFEELKDIRFKEINGKLLNFKK